MSLRISLEEQGLQDLMTKIHKEICSQSRITKKPVLLKDEPAILEKIKKEEEK